MSAPAHVRRGARLGPASLFRFALFGVAFAVGAGVLALHGCRGEVRAALSDPGLGEANAEFDPELASDWDQLAANSRRCSGERDWDGTLDGPKTFWFDNGVKRGEGGFHANKKEGPWTFWYESGQKRWEGTFDDDLPAGLERSWYENGQLYFEGRCADGAREGLHRAWYEDGRPWWEGTYLNGKKHGVYQSWRRDGTLDKDVSGRYEHGKRVAG